MHLCVDSNAQSAVVGGRPVDLGMNLVTVTVVVTVTMYPNGSAYATKGASLLHEVNSLMLHEVSVWSCLAAARHTAAVFAVHPAAALPAAAAEGHALQASRHIHEGEILVISTISLITTQ